MKIKIRKMIRVIKTTLMMKMIQIIMRRRMAKRILNHSLLKEEIRLR
jgi:hypothetical protein